MIDDRIASFPFSVTAFLISDFSTAYPTFILVSDSQPTVLMTHDTDDDSWWIAFIIDLSHSFPLDFSAISATYDMMSQHHMSYDDPIGYTYITKSNNYIYHLL